MKSKIWSEKNVEIAIQALKNSYTTHQSLGIRGTEAVKKNQFGDTAMRGDVEAEKAVLDILRQSGLPMTVVSEEHGEVSLVEDPTYLGILDGIDGSALYKSSFGVGRYGTMFGVFNGADPLFRDYVFGGIMEHSTNRLFYSVRGDGCFVLDLNNSEVVSLMTSSIKHLNHETAIHIDEYFDINQEVFMSKLTNHNVQENHLCSALHYTNLVLGDADLVLECTRKGNLEIAVAYGMVCEAGGAVVDIDGEDLANKKYRSFGQREHIPILSAATSDLAKEAAEFFRK